MSLLNRPTGEFSIWASELKAGALPSICVKSGRPARETVRVQYQNSAGAAWAGFLPGGMSRRYVVKGQLPMTTPWIAALTIARVLVIAALVAFVFGIWGVGFGHPRRASELCAAVEAGRAAPST